jgi:tetratricopeptide (TPR) repeat protein
LEKYKEAIENYDKAIQYDPRNIKAYNNKGILFEDKRECIN